ncbi:MAG: hypothetical protein RIG61_09250 [Deltaproteobacteria bacterium]
MKYLHLSVFILFFALMFNSCDETDDIFGSSNVDPLIDGEVAEAQTYDLRTPVYGMQVAIDSRVNSGTQSVLDLLDNRATQFLNCQFMEGAELGFETVMLENGTMVPPLSDLRVYVVPRRFECDAVDRDVCSGIYFFSIDAIVIAEGGFLGCGEFAVWKHELGHRYGMDADHSNQSDFEPCINAQNCNAGDLFD